MREGCGPQFWLRRSWLSVCPRTLQVASSSAATSPGLRLRLAILNRRFGLSLSSGSRSSRSTGRSLSIGRRHSRSIGRRRKCRAARSTGRRHSRSTDSCRKMVIPRMVHGRFIRAALTGARCRRGKAGLRDTRCSVSRTDIQRMFLGLLIRVDRTDVRRITVRSIQLMQARAPRPRATLGTG